MVVGSNGCLGGYQDDSGCLVTFDDGMTVSVSVGSEGFRCHQQAPDKPNAGPTAWPRDGRSGKEWLS
jgi:hypothetical protein